VVDGCVNHSGWDSGYKTAREHGLDHSPVHEPVLPSLELTLDA
jgi:hypothetical protein